MLSRRIYIIAGEPSGDLHGKNLVLALKDKNPNLRFKGFGGDKMEAAGVELTEHIRNTSFMGFFEVVKNLKTIFGLFKKVEQDLKEWRPELIILVDYPGFNLRVAKMATELGIRVVYYISPQIWAWKKSRLKQIRAYVDKMLVILPFEKVFYKDNGVEVHFVGHPLLDEIQKDIFIEVNRKNHSLALLPGSRKQEISRMLPVMLRASAAFPQFRVIVAGAPGQTESFYQTIINDSGIKAELRMNKTYEVLSQAEYAWVTSGTATLEAALFEVPQIVCYRGGWLSYLIGRMLVNIKYISLVNLILDKPLVKELIQFSMNSRNLVKQQKKLMDPVHYKYLLSEYKELRFKLGNKGASERAATEILLML